MAGLAETLTARSNPTSEHSLLFSNPPRYDLPRFAPDRLARSRRQQAHANRRPPARRPHGRVLVTERTGRDHDGRPTRLDAVGGPPSAVLRKGHPTARSGLHGYPFLRGAERRGKPETRRSRGRHTSH